MGYVGIPVATVLAQAGHEVRGIDIDAKKVAAVAEGRDPLRGREPELPEAIAREVKAGRLRATTEYGACREAAAVLIAVETPIEEGTRRPAYGALRSALKSLSENMPAEGLISVESTLAPRTMRSLVLPALEARGLRHGRDFHLVHCPERLTAGRLLYNLTNLDRVLGAEEAQGRKRGLDLYRQITRGKVHAADWLTAEVVKTVENAYWDVQLAFANEVGLLSEALGVDAFRVRELVNTSPFRNVLVPGAGVGGHCIPKDSWLLLAGEQGRLARLILAAREVNDSMPHHMAELVEGALGKAGRATRGSRVVVLGLSYKEDVEDARNSPAVPLVRELQRRGAEVVVHDPLAGATEGITPVRDLQGAVRGADCLALVTAHAEYGKLDLRALATAMRTPVLVDGRNLFDGEAARAAGLRYLGLGKPAGS